MARTKRRLGGLVLAAATAAGYVARITPGIAGPVAISAAGWMAWPPLGVLAAGVFLLLADRRVR